MTNEEAEQLIAEINKHTKEFELGEDDKQGVRYIPIYGIEQIIKRFANKPPECGLDVSIWGEESVLANMNMKLVGNRVDITIRNTCTTHSNFISFEKEDLMRLRDNCNKILEYLNDTEV